MPNRTGAYWIPAKRYGQGWGVPRQGWVVLSAFTALLSLGAVCLALVAVCRLKGEPTRWRWGDR